MAKNLLYKYIIRIIALGIKDKEQRNIWRYNKLHDDIVRLPGNSYMVKPSEVNAKIGKFVSIGSNCLIGGGQHIMSRISTSPVFYNINEDEVKAINMPCEIGNDVWIGRNVFIKPGTKIGSGVVIGSNAVVTHDVPDYAIVGGIPAKIIKYRFTPEIIEQLLASEWWNMDLKKIKSMPYCDPVKFLAELKEQKLQATPID